MNPAPLPHPPNLTPAHTSAKRNKQVQQQQYKQSFQTIAATYLQISNITTAIVFKSFHSLVTRTGTLSARVRFLTESMERNDYAFD